MKWPSIDQLSVMTPLPEGYRYDWLKHSEIPALIACIEHWHPDIAVGGGSCYLRDGFDVIGTIQVGSSPPIFPMLREPR
jgi:hypothetical protein